MARAVEQGHRVVVVYATNGDQGEVPPDLAEGETVVDRRRREAECSAQVLGTAAVHWLGYADSGMTGWAQNTAPGALAASDRGEVAQRLAKILQAEDVDVVVGYDWHGGYGHPDHIAVHHAVHAAVELLERRPRVLEVTMNRDLFRRLYQLAMASGQGSQDWDPDAPADDGNPVGTPQSEIHWQVDVSPWLDRKRAALQCHASQASDVGMMLSMPEQVFARFFGLEHYIEPGLPDGMRQGWILDE